MHSTYHKYGTCFIQKLEDLLLIAFLEKSFSFQIHVIRLEDLSIPAAFVRFHIARLVNKTLLRRWEGLNVPFSLTEELSKQTAKSVPHFSLT